jgi:hypothetical protein
MGKSDSSNNAMFFKISLDCSKDDGDAVKKHSAAALAAGKLCSDYSKMKSITLGIEPESYAEAWLIQNLIHSDREFEDLVIIYFIKILLKISGSQKRRKSSK